MVRIALLGTPAVAVPVLARLAAVLEAPDPGFAIVTP